MRRVTAMGMILMVAAWVVAAGTPIGKPEAAPCLLGQVVMEVLDFVVDCPNQRLIPNPEAPAGYMLYDDF